MVKVAEIPHSVRSKIIFHHQANMNNSEISRLLHVNRSTVSRTVQRFKETGSVASKKRAGRPRKLSAAQRRRIVVMSKRSRRSTSRELSVALGVNIHSSTIRRVLLANGLRGCIARKKPFISRVNRMKRLKFARAHLHWTPEQWNNVLFSDEKKFNRLGSDGRVYVRRNPFEAYLPECLQGTVKGGGGSCMMWACFSGFAGPGPMLRLDGRVTAMQYRDEVLDVGHFEHGEFKYVIFKVAECL